MNLYVTHFGAESQLLDDWAPVAGSAGGLRSARTNGLGYSCAVDPYIYGVNHWPNGPATRVSIAWPLDGN